MKVTTLLRVSEGSPLVETSRFTSSGGQRAVSWVIEIRFFERVGVESAGPWFGAFPAFSIW